MTSILLCSSPAPPGAKMQVPCIHRHLHSLGVLPPWSWLWRGYGDTQRLPSVLLDSESDTPACLKCPSVQQRPDSWRLEVHEPEAQHRKAHLPKVMLKTKSRREILFLNASWAHLGLHLSPYRPGRKWVFPHLPPALSLRPTQIISRTVPKATLCDPASAIFVIIDRKKSHNPQGIKESTPDPRDLDVGPGVPGTILWNTTTHFHASPLDCGLLFTTSERMPPAGPGRIDGLSGFQSSWPGPHQHLHGVERNCFFQCEIRMHRARIPHPSARTHHLLHRLTCTSHTLYTPQVLHMYSEPDTYIIH